MIFKIDDKEYNVKQLNIGDLLNEASAKVKETLRKDAMSIADELVGKERLQYLQGIPRSLPKGRELLEITSEWFNEIEGIQWIVNTACGENVDVNFSNIDLFTEMIEYIMGMEPEEKENQEENFPQAVAEKAE